VSYQFKAAGIAFHRTFEDLQTNHSILIGASIVMAYTMLGGFWAASLTDTLQGLLMAACAVALPIMALVEVGGFEALIVGISNSPISGFGSFLGAWELPAAVGFIAGLLGIGLGYPGQPHVVNRLMAMKDGGLTLRRARRIAILWAVTVYGGMLLLGLCGRILVPTLPDGEELFVELANLLLSPVFAGLTIAALLSAIMSTADSQLLAASSAMTHDLPDGWKPKNRLSLVNQSRLMVLLLGGLATMGALVLEEKIFRGVLFAWGTLGAAFGPPLLVTVFSRTLPPVRAGAAIFVGASTSIIAYYLKLTPDLKAVENVLPFFLSLAICLAPFRSKSNSGVSMRD
jgi:sodium/proline symporter